MMDHEEKLRGGQMWSRVLRRGQVLRVTDLDGGAAVAALFYNADDPLERYCMPDTLKAQHVARLTRGNVLFSDMGRILCSIVEDTCGWHDTITGHADRTWSEQRFGEGSYQRLRNDFHRNTRDNFLIELAKHGLGKKDLVPNVNLFVKVITDGEGNLAWIANTRAGAYVELRAELDTLIVLSNTPHPLDPASQYAPSPVALTVRTATLATAADDALRRSPESGRGFELTEDYFRGREGGE